VGGAAARGQRRLIVRVNAGAVIGLRYAFARGTI
jgi:hypothetical protein